jgi:hypothetical protein
VIGYDEGFRYHYPISIKWAWSTGHKKNLMLTAFEPEYAVREAIFYKYNAKK